MTHGINHAFKPHSIAACVKFPSICRSDRPPFCENQYAYPKPIVRHWSIADTVNLGANAVGRLEALLEISLVMLMLKFVSHYRAKLPVATAIYFPALELDLRLPTG